MILKTHPCPACKAVIDLAPARCPKCGVSIVELLEARAWESLVRSAVPRSRKPRRIVRPLMGALAAFAAAMGAWSLWLPSAGLPPSPDAYVDETHGFAFVLPEGWTLRPAGGGGGDGAVAARLTDGIAVIDVKLVARPSLSSLSTPSGADALLRSEFNGTEPRLETMERLQIDRLPGLRLIAGGPRTTLPSVNSGRTTSTLQKPAPPVESLNFKGMIVLVPGADAAYMIKVVADDGTFGRRRSAIESFLSSFRVSRRPSWPMFR